MVGLPGGSAIANIPAGILGPASFVASLVGTVGIAMNLALSSMVAFFLSRRLLRKDWIVASVVGLVWGVLGFVATDSWVALVIYPVTALLFLFLSVRYGLLAMVVGVYMVVTLSRESDDGEYVRVVTFRRALRPSFLSWR